jgi:hypothetical protein
MKGAIKEDHIPVNKYQLNVLGLPPLTCTEISGLEEELITTTLPDRTVASGGDTNPVEFDAMIPEHHIVEQAAMEAWFVESQDPVLPSYKKVGTLISESVSGGTVVTKSLVGIFPKKRATPDREMANEGEMAAITWTFSVDKVLPI